MIARLVLGELLEAEQMDLDFSATAQSPTVQAAPPADRPPTHGSKWIVGSISSHGMKLDELYGDRDGVLAVVEMPGDSFLNKPARRIGIAGSGSASDYDPVGSTVEIKVDTQRGYRNLGRGKVVAYTALNDAAARAAKVRSLYHFD